MDYQNLLAVAWSEFAAAVLANSQAHPGSYPNIEAVACETADKMLKEFRKRFPEPPGSDAGEYVGLLPD